MGLVGYQETETCSSLLEDTVLKRLSGANRDLKQIDAAVERWQSTSKFLFKITQGQVNSVGP